MEGQKICHGKPDGQGKKPGDPGVFEGIDIGCIGDARRQHVTIVGQDKCWDHGVSGIVPKADHHDGQERKEQKAHEHQGEWHDL